MTWWKRKNTWERAEFWNKLWFVSMVLLILITGAAHIISL